MKLIAIKTRILFDISLGINYRVSTLLKCESGS